VLAFIRLHQSLKSSPPLVVFAEDKILMAMLMDLMGSHLKDMEKNWLLSKNRNKTEVAHGIGK